MVSQEIEKDIVLKMADALYKDLSCVIYIDNRKQKYTFLKGDNYWKQAVAEQGDLSKLVYQLFAKMDNDHTSEDNVWCESVKDFRL